MAQILGGPNPFKARFKEYAISMDEIVSRDEQGSRKTSVGETRKLTNYRRHISFVFATSNIFGI